jgi:uncharacterized circularly permuted ATP-grasp superfamily protein/uncharacterized alpha-E superfamily protein
MTQTAHDELLDEQRRLRAPWRRVLGTLLGLGTAQLRERAAELDRAFAEEGAAALLTSKEGGQWRCDPIPFLFTEAEFSWLTTALAQRARLLEAVLSDLYGARTLLAEGLLPPSLVYPSPRYLPACRDMNAARHLTLYAADLVRCPDGTWRVLADRTAEPGGLAYALENRRMMARVLPEPFRAVEVAPLRPFFDHWQDFLQREATSDGATPALALLTPGHADPRWFEHVVLARELGCTLVEAGDLTVRDGALYLKTLHGLRAVHVLLRWQDGADLDPLDIHTASTRGIPGLFCAMREDAVRVMNSPGAAYAESPGLAPYLPQLCRRLLGEKLALDSELILWLGDPGARALVEADLPSWIVRPALDGRLDPESPKSAGDAVALANLRDRIARAPWEFAAIKAPMPSYAPCTGNGETLEPRGVILRLFLLWDGVDWRPLPGGIALVATDEAPVPGRLPRQALSKDVWVILEEGADIVGPGNFSVPALQIRRTAGDMPSRVADNFYWFGRYLERLENAARLTRAVLARLARPGLTPRELPELSVLAECLALADIVTAELSVGAGPAALTVILQRALVRDNGAFAEMTSEMQRLADTLRDRLSGEMHAMIAHGVRALKGARLALRSGKRGASPGLLADFAGRILEFCATVSGYAAENMVRGGGRMFLDLGRRIERAQALATQLACILAQPPAHFEGGLTLALELCDSTLTYRSRYLNVVQPAAVLDLVLADEGNPRGLAYQLATARGILGVLGGRENEPLAALLDAPLADSAQIVKDLIGAADQSADAAEMVPPRLHAIAEQVAVVAHALARQYFSLLPVSWTETLN